MNIYSLNKMRNFNSSIRFSIAISIILFFSFGCATSTAQRSYQAKGVYDNPPENIAKQINKELVNTPRNALIIIPGFLGSLLKNKDSNKIVWGEFSSRSLSSEQIALLSFPMAIDKKLNELHKKTVAVDVMKVAQVNIAAMSIHLPEYSILENMLKSVGYDDSNLLFFAYDWRFDIAENAAKLHDFIENKRKILMDKYPEKYPADKEFKFDIIAHSMGGLLANYYLRYGNNTLPEKGLPKLSNAGCKRVEKLIMVGTPNNGYLDIFIELIDGLKLMSGSPIYPAYLLGTFPSCYQMLPDHGAGKLLLDNGEELDPFELDTWLENQIGLANPKIDDALKVLLPETKTPQERRNIAINHLKKSLKRAKQFRKAISVKNTNVLETDIYMFLGKTVPTSGFGFLFDTEDNHSLRVQVKSYIPGDGKVPSSSAEFNQNVGLLSKHTVLASPVLWRAVYQTGGAHMGLFNTLEFHNNIPFILIKTPNLKD